ncbi:N-acetylmuramoyl-L-alanine amidase CwlD [Clostridium thailandense]|uniref:N-acetylmuramoyl-L-alanine amidase CwlD n=1 Tax=Clostridium thailandense TaxID=2794346 RepID=A0A949WWD0_9CLOT|nr:N-acetylmuramoyl-L-alanine amidase CwlD [Clostridium thailandense]MBV7274672.1 N-acetylmuramoyl-L-alanine amidase CwlD [Clostridium thailandense]
MQLKNAKLLIVIFIIFLGLASIFYANTKYTMTTDDSKTKKQTKDITILVDPGHGGIDGGAVSPSGVMEKDINLKISLKLKDKLKNDGYNVILTREEDKGLYTDDGKIRKKKVEDLNNRCKMKNDSECDMFVSIHLNMFTESKYSGAQVWYSRNKDSERFAGILQSNLKRDLDPNNNRKEKPALDSYKVLRCNDNMPSVLIECGFLSNYNEEQKLKSEEYQNKIVESVENSIKNYYNE